jgi:hypothetical protein
MQVTIDFHPTVNGEINDELAIIYDTGLFSFEIKFKNLIGFLSR